MSAVEQLVNGAKVVCADGTAVVCKPIPLKHAKQIIDLWEKRMDPKAEPLERARARMAVATIFADLYPELAAKVSPGDVENLLPDFFWAATGAAVPATSSSPETTPTGTAFSDATSPPGASS